MKITSKKVLGWIVMIVALLATLGIGFAMIGGALPIPYIDAVVMKVAGWIIVIGSILSVILHLFFK